MEAFVERLTDQGVVLGWGIGGLLCGAVEKL